MEQSRTSIEDAHPSESPGIARPRCYRRKVSFDGRQ
jgi:hypothetical protein